MKVRYSYLKQQFSNSADLWVKLKKSVTLVKPIDWFDLIMHAAPWILLLIKMFLTMKENAVTDNS